MFKSLLLAVVPLTLVSSDQVHHDTGTTGYANLIPNGFSALRDYEVLEVRQEEHEDVVFLRKRGNTDCDTDCFAYSAWTDDSVCSSTAEEVQERSNRLTKRDPKKGSYCNVALEEDGAVQPAFELESRAWPSPEQVETVSMLQNIFPYHILTVSRITSESTTLETRQTLWILLGTKSLLSRRDGQKACREGKVSDAMR
jgi:hypothetical protein